MNINHNEQFKKCALLLNRTYNDVLIGLEKNYSFAVGNRVDRTRTESETIRTPGR